MAYKIFLDANVILDHSLKRKGYEDVKNIFLAIESGILKAYISSSILHILYYILNKELSNKICKEILINILTETTIIDTPQEVAINAIVSKFDDTEDALQYYTAMHHKIPYFISNDKKLKKESINTLPVYTSSEFVKDFL
jgi:predicted nucleic acid-binding protein